ncbi:MAG: alpha-ketoacid dehydrogenase subunit beta, partial [Deltaproteobacteria bacterium]
MMLTLIQAINDALKTEMKHDDRVVVFGEDVGYVGGVFRATEGIQKEFGEKRCFDTPLSECGIIGTAVGMALYGMRPVAEIQFLDFIYPSFDQIVSEAAKMRYRSGGQFTVPLVIRTPYGGGIKGGHYHSQSMEAFFAHTPGLKVVIPSTPEDAKGLLISSIRDEDPVIFLEPKRLYRSVKGEVPEGDFSVPLGKARVIRFGGRSGEDVSLFCYGAMAPICEEAAREADKKG